MYIYSLGIILFSHSRKRICISYPLSPRRKRARVRGDKRRKYMDKLENILQNNNLEEGYNLLTKRERKIINLYYLEGYRDEEISKLYGINRQNVNRQRKRGISKLKIF
jgi:RNA polymerase sigma factor (sigma-70 family)